MSVCILLLRVTVCATSEPIFAMGTSLVNVNKIDFRCDKTTNDKYKGHVSPLWLHSENDQTFVKNQ